MSAYECQYTKESYTTVSSKYGSHVQNTNTISYRLSSLKEKIKQIPTFKLKCHKVFLTDLLPIITI